MSDFSRQNKNQLASRNLFVVLHRIDKLLVLLVRTISRQFNRLEQLRLSIQKRLIDHTHVTGQTTRTRHPDRDRLAMQEPAVSKYSFDCVPKRMAVIQNRTSTRCLGFVLFDHGGFALTTPADRFGQRICVTVVKQFNRRFEIFKQRQIHNQAVFDHFGQPSTIVGIVKRIEHQRIDQNRLRLPKRANHILGLRQIDSDFPTNATVNLSQQCGWNLNKLEPAPIGRRQKTGEVTNDATTQRDHDRFSIGIELNHFLPDLVTLADRL